MRPSGTQVRNTIARSAKNNYRNILASGDGDDFAWVQDYLNDRSICPLVLVPMLQAAIEDRCKLAASVLALTDKTEHLREKVKSERVKLLAARKKLTEARDLLAIAQRNRWWRA